MRWDTSNNHNQFEFSHDLDCDVSDNLGTQCRLRWQKFPLSKCFIFLFMTLTEEIKFRVTDDDHKCRGTRVDLFLSLSGHRPGTAPSHSCILGEPSFSCVSGRETDLPTRSSALGAACAVRTPTNCASGKPAVLWTLSSESSG